METFSNIYIRLVSFRVTKYWWFKVLLLQQCCQVIDSMLNRIFLNYSNYHHCESFHTFDFFSFVATHTFLHLYLVCADSVLFCYPLSVADSFSFVNKENVLLLSSPSLFLFLLFFSFLFSFVVFLFALLTIVLQLPFCHEITSIYISSSLRGMMHRNVAKDTCD